MKQFTATANDDGVRLSRFVQSVTRDFPTKLGVAPGLIPVCRRET